MDLDAYVAEHGGEWRRLEVLVSRRRLKPGEADELVLLYQRAATHLSIVRSRTPDAVVLADLSRLVLAGRAAITRGNRMSWRPAADFFVVRLPAALYLTRGWWLTVMVVMVAAVWGLIAYVLDHPSVLTDYYGGRPEEASLIDDFVNYYSEYRAGTFFGRVWVNNAMLAAQCLASGVLILPVFYLLGANLISIGMVGAAMFDAGAGDIYLTYLAPHGFLELTAIFIGGGVGLRIGWSWIAPGPLLTRRESLVHWARHGMVVAVGLVFVLLVAGILEAWVTPSPLPPLVRVGIGAGLWLLFLVYALLWGARAARRP
ncbi:stage II sporulation protein M [Actinoplanes derwentensis]|uniref:Stage II sporulation protein M n=1 Tax=Actinoplanes derwentensis TaxID=113562 RepID=A0A1H1WHI0_9ACTN|nr:stage II sporulation protein M [Actinoplanes derwentensis]GID87442.1 membrane protein [Actinoplanes derwentensis]SDS96737.1 Stage II sporulation protein M [Actinoplanes derwentensis]